MLTQGRPFLSGWRGVQLLASQPGQRLRSKLTAKVKERWEKAVRAGHFLGLQELNSIL